MLRKKQKRIFGPPKKRVTRIDIIFGSILLLLGAGLIFYANYSNVYIPINLMYGITGAGAYLIILGLQFLLGIE